MKYYMSPGVFNIYAPRGSTDGKTALWHTAMYEEEHDGYLKMIGIFPSIEPSHFITKLIEIGEVEARVIFEGCDNLLPNHKMVPDIKPAA